MQMSHTPEEGAHSPSWPNGLIIIIIIIIILIIIIIIIIILIHTVSDWEIHVYLVLGESVRKEARRTSRRIHVSQIVAL
jgi:flagellar basal body-associated protein FliL